MLDVEARARESEGGSSSAVYEMISRALVERGLVGGRLVDVGCGVGTLASALPRGDFRYVGVDVVAHPAFPRELELVLANLDREPIPLPDASADIVVSAETIEHVENPRALMRELVRLLRPGGWLFVTTPNQLSMASLLCLVARGEFQYFQRGPGMYPAHITALLEVDLRRVAEECSLVNVDVLYSGSGRVPFTPRPWPKVVGARRGFRGRAFSDNVLVCGTKPV
ncbi:MAG TPA: methyltransferase domain-containing protein [Polyangiaceae bacterium]